MALDLLTAPVTITLPINAQKNVTGSDYSPNTNQTNLLKKFTLGTAVANALATGADEIYSAVTSLAGSASASIDLTSITDLLGTAAVSLARVKFLMIRVLSVADDAVIGTAAAGVTVDNTVANALSSQSNSGWFNNAAEGAANGSRFCVPNGAVLLFGTPTATGVLVDGTHKVIKVTNLDGAVTAKVQVTLIGGST